MEAPIITITEGKLRGTILKSMLGMNYFAFKGIPFAQPPIGPLRFKAPQPPLKWSGIRDASENAGDIPMQYQWYGPPPFKMIGSEDCLYLNVYTNAIVRKRPVMVFIYGGIFRSGAGDGSRYNEQFLVSQDMVFVVFNYRLGPMGFLNLGHEDASGNQGIRDVLMALKWVQRNIEAFGGDPDNVTIWGNSAGSMTCQLLTLIPAAKGLFHKVIVQGGTVTSYCPDILYGEGSKSGFQIAARLGMESDDPVEVLEFLRSIPGEDLIALQARNTTNYGYDKKTSNQDFSGTETFGQTLYLRELIRNVHEYGPVYDAPYTKDPVIPLPLAQLMDNEADVPMIIGHNEYEGLSFFKGCLNDDTYELFNQNLDIFVQNMLPLKYPGLLPDIMRKILKFYFNNKPIDENTKWNLVYLMTDLVYINQNRKIIDNRNKRVHSSTYNYKFTFNGNVPTIYEFERGPQRVKGITHGTELSYLFHLVHLKGHLDSENQCPQKGSKERLMMERMLRMWYNFAATGNPTPVLDDQIITTTWMPSDEKNLYYLEIGDELIIRSDKDSKSRELYHEISRQLIW
ncbi:hypothetical protein QAD02_011523 [Eretmocerus hayati]|uniref:Uncharacterized protein n=1 Tax=Eretmocerus hayati TaxID=131215 RepID=A0ACC2NX92_9HYME|nr:hypothetical protein QAD02_011523 [Eretmocerus hayati]